MSEDIVAELREIHRRELALHLVPANKDGEKCVTRIRIDLLSEAADEIEYLRATNEKRLERNRSQAETIDAIWGEKEVVTQDRDHLLTVLKPFASIPLADIETAAHYWCMIGTPDRSHFTREDLERARAVLEWPT